MTNNRPNPNVLSLIVCDQIITDRMTGKQSLIGMFSRVHAPRFPTAHPQLSVFVTLTDGHGKSELTIRIVDTNDERPPIVEGKGTVDFKNPRAIANLALQFHGLTFPQPGEYRVQLWSEGELLREARLELIQVKARRRKPGGGKGGSSGKGSADGGVDDLLDGSADHSLDDIQGGTPENPDIYPPDDSLPDDDIDDDIDDDMDDDPFGDPPEETA